MKEFDIEKLKRENIFKTPAGFFEDMQNKVLQEVAPVQRGNIIKLNWAYGAAAAIALLIGVSVFFNSGDSAEQESFAKTALRKNNEVTYTLSDDKPKIEDAIVLPVIEQDLPSVAEIVKKSQANSISVSEKDAVTFAARKEKSKTPNPEVQVDQILATFTSAEMADVGRNTEQDIYLDLYN